MNPNYSCFSFVAILLIVPFTIRATPTLICGYLVSAGPEMGLDWLPKVWAEVQRTVVLFGVCGATLVGWLGSWRQGGGGLSAGGQAKAAKNNAAELSKLFALGCGLWLVPGIPLLLFLSHPPPPRPPFPLQPRQAQTAAYSPLVATVWALNKPGLCRQLNLCLISIALTLDLLFSLRAPHNEDDAQVKVSQLPHSL